MICWDCLDGLHGRCLLKGCACSTCALPLRAAPSAPRRRVATTRAPATKRVSTGAMGRPKAYTDDQKTEALRLVAEGLSRAEAAETVGLSEAQVMRLARGLPGRRRWEKVGFAADRRRIDLPQPMIHAIAEELLRGGGYQFISEKAGCKYNQVRTIQRQLKALDVELRNV